MSSWFRRFFTATDSNQQEQKLSNHHETRLQQIRDFFGDQFDFMETSVLIEPANATAMVFYFASIADETVIRQHILRPTQRGLEPQANVIRSKELNVIIAELRKGRALLLREHEDDALLIDVQRNLARNIEEASSEFVTRGPRDGLTENLQQNVGLIRKRLRGTNLQAQSFVVGKKTMTNVVLLCIAELARQELIEDIVRRIEAIDTDAIFDTGQIEELIEYHPLSPFDTFMNTERPEKIAADLLEGRVAILVDGSPTAIIGPTTFFQHLSSPDDYYQRYLAGSIHRLLRFLGFFLSAHLSAVYLSLVLYHSHLIPMKLVEILMAKREQVPFPPLFEVLMMQVMIDLVLEAILRLPNKLGQIIGVSGAIVIGQAAISANLISPGVIIVVSITTITGYVMPRLSTSYTLQLLRYTNLLMAAFLGGFGLMVAMMFWLIHLCNLHSLGQAYLSPMSPFKLYDMRDMLFRLPKWLMRAQPDHPGSKEAVK
jgi:hypothetical protein